MRVLEHSGADKPNENAFLTPVLGLIERVTGSLGLSSKQKERESQEVIVARLGKMLDNSYTLLRNHPLPGVGVEIPFVLVGPPGVRLLYPSADSGIYRARDTEWLVMNDRTRSFEPAKPNLIETALRMAHALHKFMGDQGLELPGVEPVMLFTNPGIHVDTANPAVRIVPRDGIEKFAAGLLQAPVFLSNEDVQVVANVISRPGSVKGRSLRQDQRRPPEGLDIASEELRLDEFGLSSKQMGRKPRGTTGGLDLARLEKTPGIFDRLPFSRTQMIVLSVMLVLSICFALTALISLIIFYS
jgi:hypothetical protein